ncbi:hypothetical protein [Paenibacillus spongiae]|uniref:Uncharacterized protein n=1 Tax=Paenibacillus spongiae TaxID=2909671 RepID=A0ABY5SLM8_9BACL|nr:hypothetical protein [Paenibacillus spongiae]UVI33148.1 hypothetical protein L1F29_15475 [Paenibacillus spongiae]
MADNSIRTVIPGLQPVNWSDPARQSEYGWSVVSALHQLGETISYEDVICLSGSAFRASITSSGFNPGDYHVVHNMEIVPHTFRMLGYDVTIHEPSDYEIDKKRIMNSIDSGYPVLTLEGVITCSDCCIIGGYDEGGEVLLGYNPFMDQQDDHNEPHDVTGYFRKSNWHHRDFQESGGKYIIIHGQTAKLSKRDMYLDTIKLACKLIKGTKTGEHLDGFAGHTRYAELLCEKHEDPFGLYLNILCQLKLYNDKIYVSTFLRGMKDEFPEYADTLEKAANCYDEVSSLRCALSKIIAEDFTPFNKPLEYRQLSRYADVIIQIRDWEQMARNYLIIDFDS